MSQKIAWEKEYNNPKFITNSNEPQLDFKHFVKWLRKHEKISLDGLMVLDLGSGTGKNGIFLSERGSIIKGIELSEAAKRLSDERSNLAKVEMETTLGSIGEAFPFPDGTFDLLIDVVSSNSLNEEERKNFIVETYRVLKPGGYFFVKALCKEGDKNALNLLNMSPGQEKDTYILPGTGIAERVFEKLDIENLFNQFSFLHMERKSSYTVFDGKPFKRQFWLIYLQKPLK